MPRTRLFYHFVWGTKERLPLITDVNRQTIYGAISAKAKEMDGIVHALNGMSEHVHLVATVPPKLSLADFVGQVKGNSSHLATHLHTPFSDKTFAWQSEYGVTTVSESHLPVVVGYVVNQQKHHAENSLNDKLEDW